MTEQISEVESEEWLDSNKKSIPCIGSEHSLKFLIRYYLFTQTMVVIISQIFLLECYIQKDVLGRQII